MLRQWTAADVWPEFKRRFRIPQVLDSTHPLKVTYLFTTVRVNPAAIGRVPSFLAHRSNLVLVKFDVQIGALMRNSEGLCLRCQPGEIGERSVNY